MGSERLSQEGEEGRLEDIVRLGRGREIVSVPQVQWLGALRERTTSTRSWVAGLPEFHRRLRRFLVGALPENGGQPLSVERIASRLGASREDVRRGLDELESRLFFVVRDAEGAVSWAFPCTTEHTPHRLGFSTRERLWGA